MYSTKSILKLILPLMAEQFLAIAVGSIDTIMVTSIGESAMAAVSAMDSLNVLFITMFTAIGAGGAVVASHYLGRKDTEGACMVATQLMLVSLSLSVVISALVIGLHKPLIGLLDKSGDMETIQRSYTYLTITALSFPFLGAYNGSISLLRAMGDTKSSMKMSLVMNVVNIFGNALLIYVFKLDVAGAALATLISRALISVVIMKKLFNRDLVIHLPATLKGFFLFDRKKCMEVFRQGIPAGIENSLFHFGKILVMSVVSSLPTALRAANGICNTLVSFTNAPGNAVGMGAVALIGPLVGAGKKEEAMKLGKKMLLLMYAVELPVNILMVFLARPLTGLYVLSDIGREAAIQVVVLYSIIAIFGWTPALGLPLILRSAGDARYTMMVSTATMLLLRVGACYFYVYALDLSLMGIWLAMFTDWVARSTFFLLRFFRGKWLSHGC